MALAPGTKLGLYEIQSPLGAGGMGEVYRATDTKLGRDIALKVLPAEMAHDPERLARFRREAKALAQLDHPNIVTIHSVEESDGVHFLTMQLVEGQPLDRLIPPDGLPVEQIVEIASALGDALAAAHEKGIMHRDLKPANVMVSNEGRVKVLDFGLAKDVRAAGLGDATMTSASQTQVGVVMGTPAYMSPEQTAGRLLDHRTDIFSLGVVLHEMATGRRPFEGTSSAELVSAILRDTPPSVTDLRPDLPSDLARIIRRCLEKDPRHRVQTARDVSNEFRDLTRQISPKMARATTSKSRAALVPDFGGARADEGFWVAVLPFKYSGGNADLKALAEGLTEDIVTGLSRFSYLRVIARSSTARYAGEAVDVRSAGKELGARYVMEGSLRQAGTKLRLAIQLVDAVSGTHLWAENYERTFSPENIFALQDDLAPRIVSTVADQHGVLPHSMSHLIRNKSDEQLSPYEALLRVFGLHERMSPDEHASVRTLLERTVQNAPGEGDCWAMLATLYCDEYMFGFPGEPDPLKRAQAAARRAIEIGPSNWLASQAVAQSLFFAKEWQAFRPVAERTIALNRMDGAACAFMGILLALSGEWERGCQVAHEAMQLNPHHPGWYWLAAVFNAYRKQDYRASVDAALRINMPGYFWGPATSGAAFGQLGNSERAQKAVTELLAIRPDFAETARPEFAKWFDEELSEHYVEGLRKAGLEIGDRAGVAVKAPDSGALRAVEGFWVAVLPFKSTGTELTSLAEGLSEEIVTGLSRFSYLRVIARGSTLKYANQTTDLRTVGKELGARYVMEGSLRQGGARLRVTVQLIDATTGTQMWAETYERAFGPEAIFEVQDDLVPRIVATVADHDGVLPQSMAEVLRNKSEDQLTPHEATLRSFRFFKNLDVEEHATAKRVLERAVRSAPNHGDCWAMLSHMYSNDYWHGPDSRPEDLERALAAARRAVDVAPSNHLSYWALALALYLKRDIPAFRLAAERAIELNRMDGSSVAFMGSLIAISGDWERGCAIAEPASALNPNHAGWHRFLALYNAYNKGDYQAARAAALRLNIPENFQDPAARAAVFGQLGEPELGRKAVQELLALQPDFASMARTFYSKWLGPELVVRLIEGWRKAGLEIDGATSAASPSGATRAEEGFWVALLPIKYNGSNADLTALADGLTEDIVTGLSRFSYLRVIARSSTARYARESVDVRAAGKEVGARYVMEGSLRQAGTKLRLAVQLVDAVSGAHLWAENYERAFRPEALFELQDDLVPRIVSTIADMNGVLPRSMSEAVRSRNPDQLSPYEAVLRSFGYMARVTPEDLAAARSGLELAVRKAPDYADAWAMLAFLCVQDYGQGFSLQADSLTSGLTAARRAVDAAPSNPLAYCSLAQALFFQKEFQSFRNAAERAVALNPMDGNSIAFLGELLTYAGDWERGLALSGRAKQLNPNHPGWYWYADFYNSYRQGDFRAALGFALKINLPGQWASHAMIAASRGQLKERDAASRSLRDLLILRPDLAVTVGKEFGKWWEPEYVEQLIDGLRKAGLQIAGGEDEGVRG